MDERRYYRFAAPVGVFTVSVFGLANTPHADPHPHPAEALPALIQPREFGGGTATIAAAIPQAAHASRSFGGGSILWPNG